jgi:hypothetical protein
MKLCLTKRELYKIMRECQKPNPELDVELEKSRIALNNFFIVYRKNPRVTR